MDAFIKTLLCGNGSIRDARPGILGTLKAYYGCVEAQGRGTLHCHMVIWLEGGLNPNELQDRIRSGGDEFRQRLVSYLDDTISTCVPPDLSPNPSSRLYDHKSRSTSKPHPSSIRGLPLLLSHRTSPEEYSQAAHEDLRNLVQRNQTHKHSKTCYKYCSDGPQVCRFDLDPSHVVPQTIADPESGELTLRCLDGMINNFNATILRALRCNMDIQFIGSGTQAQAILYYITDYVTKSPLKTHVAYAALELAVQKLDVDTALQGTPSTERAKRLLQKCAFALVANQELSGQQVASYLLDYDDRFTSNKFRNLYWPSFERYIEKQRPSPEC
ncbi:hypothetical protein C8Q76DRAFT_587604, partial [Earliella scabrosa]